MRLLKITTIISLLLSVIGLVGCSMPAYYNPYEEGVDPDTLVTGGFQSRPSVSTTAFRLATTTTTMPPITTTTELIVPAGYRVCPTCGGVRMKCEYCNGTDKRRAEALDPDSGIYKKYYENCQMCSTEDPGYLYCETCRNNLVIPE